MNTAETDLRLSIKRFATTASFLALGIITPAISVLSAIEGLELISPALHFYVVPITVIILMALFSKQRHGTEKIGRIFEPITLLWFLTLGLLGLVKVIDNPHVLMAMSPHYAIDFFALNGWRGFVVLGSGIRTSR